MDVQREPARRSHRESLTPSPIILPAEAIAVTLLIFAVVLGLMMRNGA
jgi:hypothetical protein